MHFSTQVGHMTQIKIIEVIEDVIAALRCCASVASGGVEVIIQDQVVKLKSVSSAVEQLKKEEKQ
jgi:hypothetical protein